MSSLVPTDLKKGTFFLLNGELYESLDYQQKAVGRQQATVAIKARHLKTQKVQHYTFSGSESLQAARLEKMNVDFLYSDNTQAYFMSPDSFEQYDLPLNSLQDQIPYLSPNLRVVLVLFEGQPLTIILPKNVFLKVIFAKDVVKGNTASSVVKTAELETGLKVKVPAFIKINDVVSVDTASGFYRERQK